LQFFQDQGGVGVIHGGQRNQRRGGMSLLIYAVSVGLLVVALYVISTRVRL
jgi:hypothetical protein